MTKRIFAALLAALFCAFAFAPAAFAAEGEETTKKLPQGITIACVGDSITYGSGSGNSSAKPGLKNDLANYPGQLAALIGGTPNVIGGGATATNVTFQNDACTVYNDGRASAAVLNDVTTGGDFAKGAMYIPEIKKSFERTDLDVVVLMLSTNDSKISAFRTDRKDNKYELGIWDTKFATHDKNIGDILDESGNVVARPTPAQEFEARYRAILNKYFEMDSKPYVYCMLPIPALNKDIGKNYRISDENMRTYINPIITGIVEDLKAEGYPIGLIDMRSQFPDPTTEEGAAELQKLLVDEVHPNSDGYTIMAETVYNRLLADTHSLSFVAEDADEGSAIPKNVVVFGDSTVKIKSTRGMLTKDGVANIGWSTEPNGAGTVYNEGDEITFNSETGDITLYPVWGKAPAGNALTIVIIAVSAVVVLGLFAGGIVILKKNKKND